MGLITVNYEVTNKLICVFGNVLLVRSISNVGRSSKLHCGMKADPACQWLPIFTDHFPPVKWHPKIYTCWEEDDERNTGHLGKKKMLYKFSWQEGAGSSPNRSLPVSSSLDSTVRQCDEWAPSGKRKEATLSHWAHSEKYFYCSPSNQSSRKYFIGQNELG